MKTSHILLSTTILFTFFTVTFEYQVLLYNYKHWPCWDYSCPWVTEDCEEICKDVDNAKDRVELTREERREKCQKLSEIYDLILKEYTDTKGIIDGLFSREYGSLIQTS